MMAEGVKDSNLWPQFSKPETLQQVMLETSMKKAVYEWIENAFTKLKNHTSRSKLLMKKQVLEGTDRLDDFIVRDDIEEEEGPMIEFVPLMILHGDGIGKNTLIEVIMQMVGGQIYEINTSNNRGKKDILDNLLEFSTSHYVKGQGSKGIILLDDVDVIFKEHDKFFWGAIEKLLWQSRRPVVLICRNLSLVPNNLVQVAQQEQSIFHASKVSVRTTTSFLKSFCIKNGIVPNDVILNHLAKVNRRDIRKSLMALQFYCQPPGKFPLGQLERNKNDDLSFDDAVHYSDLLSHSDILSSNCQWKSAILQDKDLTHLSYESRSILDSIPDDQERLRHDYMIDNKMHLVDDTRRPLLPFELNVGGYMENHLLAYYKGPNSVQNLRDRRFNTIKETSVAFLSSRIGKKESSISNITRKTRNSKKLRQILEGFQGNYPKSAIDDSINFNFKTTSGNRLGELVNPYVLKFAQSDWNKRQINKRLFKQAINGFSEGEYFNAVAQLSQDGLFKNPYFEADPKLVIDSWE
ncbi:P-loop containing nucleoside triphosphate hydrolase protein [Zygosaccharomyces rouxii]|nr:P-loop containing nucleoside triphosphate hydrolase protein [Zygosaccharomyces rouxii]